MKEQIKYSIIIPAYNAEKHLNNILEFINKTHYRRKDIEFIIINDGSTDNTNNILKNNKSIVYHSQNNCGVSLTRNNGLSLANGEYILFLDVDDEFDIDIFDILDNNINKEIDFHLFNYSIEGKIKNKNFNFKPYFSSNELIELFFLKKIYIHICSICIRKEFLIKNKLTFPIGFSFGEDIYFIITLLYHTDKKIKFINSTLFNYKLSNSSTVSSKVTMNKTLVLSLYSKLYEKLEKEEQILSLTYFIQVSYLYLIKLSIKHGTENKETIHKLKDDMKLLKLRSIKDNHLPYKLLKILFIFFSKIIFKSIK